MNKTNQTARNNLRSVGNSNGSKTGNKPDTASKTAAASEALAAGTATDPANQPNVATITDGPVPKVTNIFAAHSEKVRESVSQKLTLLQTGRQKLAEAQDRWTEGGTAAKQAEEIAADGMLALYQARVTEAGGKPLLSSDELTGTLRDIFGSKRKKDGTESKTPDGQGEAIRKRIVRAVALQDFVNGGDGGTFFEGFPQEDAEDILHQVNEGTLSMWSAYDKLALIKREGTTRVDPAFNPQSVGKLAETLAKPGSAAIIARSPALIANYAALINVLNIVGAEAAAITTAKAAEPLEPGQVAA